MRGGKEKQCAQWAAADDGGRRWLNKKQSWCLARTLMGELACQQPSALADHSGAREAMHCAPCTMQLKHMMHMKQCTVQYTICTLLCAMQETLYVMKHTQHTSCMAVDDVVPIKQLHCPLNYAMWYAMRKRILPRMQCA